jgi:hypothetical protein
VAVHQVHIPDVLIASKLDANVCASSFQQCVASDDRTAPKSATCFVVIRILVRVLSKSPLTSSFLCVFKIVINPCFDICADRGRPLKLAVWMADDVAKLKSQLQILDEENSRLRSHHRCRRGFLVTFGGRV